MTGTSPLRIIIADDHALVRGGMSLLFKSIDPDVEIVECNGYENVLETLDREKSIDLLMLDLLMPGMDLIKSVQNICERWPDVPLVLVSVREDTQIIRQSFRVGVSGYIPKTSTPEVTINAIRLILSGGIYVPPGALQIGGGQSGASSQRDAIADAQGSKDRDSGLTARQFEVLDLVAQGKSNVEVGAELNLTEGTVKMHLSRIFKVLNVKSRTEAAAKIRNADAMRNIG